MRTVVNLTHRSVHPQLEPSFCAKRPLRGRPNEGSPTPQQSAALDNPPGLRAELGERSKPIPPKPSMTWK